MAELQACFLRGFFPQDFGVQRVGALSSGAPRVGLFIIIIIFFFFFFTAAARISVSHYDARTSEPFALCVPLLGRFAQPVNYEAPC